MEIVGVVGDAEDQDGEMSAFPTFFIPFLQRSPGSTIGKGPGLDRSHYPAAIELQVVGAVMSCVAEKKQP